MKSRRQFLAAGAPLCLLPQMSFATEDYFMPDEGAPHTRTWMAFGAQRSIWGKRLLPEVQRNLALIANTIADFEPVTMLVRPEEVALARKSVTAAVSLLETTLDDLWIRDTGPTFLINEIGGKAAVDFNFNGWAKSRLTVTTARSPPSSPGPRRSPGSRPISSWKAAALRSMAKVRRSSRRAVSSTRTETQA